MKTDTSLENAKCYTSNLKNINIVFAIGALAIVVISLIFIPDVFNDFWNNLKIIFGVEIVLYLPCYLLALVLRYRLYITDEAIVQENCVFRFRRFYYYKDITDCRFVSFYGRNGYPRLVIKRGLLRRKTFWVTMFSDTYYLIENLKKHIKVDEQTTR